MSESMFPEWIMDAMRKAYQPGALEQMIRSEIVEENDAEERTLLGINLEYVCPACGEQVVIYNLTKERVVQEIGTIVLADTQPTLNCQLEWIKFALVAVLDQDQVTVHETVIIKEIES
ncbi:hypothetical protein HWC34_gp21 [Microbacterium phage Alex44]|uniref:Uncharacterized protein n=1 Tax=Microbacterium phage Alex44 TaxID=2590877 RepID=A0A4Y6EF03_9CAUD|nr:hypothetical protein HWC34_gp21 [Microbacterium phage Alex44]QDF15931.1 hypothetical protein SEA_ALEX44_21 [Microbacterium phage Alex44]